MNELKPSIAGAAPFRVGVLAFSDGRPRVHQTLEAAIATHSDALLQALRQDPLLEAPGIVPIAASAKAAREGAQRVRRDGAEAVVFNVPVFAFPNFSLIAARILDQPVLLSSPKNPGLPGLGGIMAAHGAMRQIGLKSRKLWGDPNAEPALAAQLSAFCRASGVIERMKGSVYGLIGGRSIGMNTGAVCAAQWMKQFGVDVEHIDQLEIKRRAGLCDEAEVQRGYEWLTSRAGRVATDGKAAPQHVKEQIRYYLAARSLVEEFGLDFVGVKCHYDLSEFHHTACMIAMLLNDPYDWNGPKPPVMMACEADGDGALTMQILRLISGHPSLLFDVRSYDFENGLFVCCNCGAMPSWYAARSDNPDENLARVFLEPVIAKYAGGGAHASFVCRAGEITLARLSRVEGQYRMFLARGEFVEFPREKMAETCASWPHGFVRLNVTPEAFIEVFNTNHAHVVPGDHRLALRMYCDFMGIPVDELAEG